MSRVCRRCNGLLTTHRAPVHRHTHVNALSHTHTHTCTPSSISQDKPKDDNKEKERKVVLQAKMQCNCCRHKVYKAIVGYPGVEEINIDVEGQKVTLKVGKDVDPFKLFAVLYNKRDSKITGLLAFPPLPTPNKVAEKKKVEPKDVTVVLKACVHCASSKKKLMEIAWRVGDVYYVHVEADKVTIKGKDLDPKKVCTEVAKRYGKRVELVPPKEPEQSKPKNDPEQNKDKSMKVEGPCVYQLHYRVYPPRAEHADCEHADCVIM